MSFKSIDHSSGSPVHIDRVDLDVSRVVSAVDKCTGEVAKLHIKKIPPPIINNEIVTPPATVVNKIPENKPEIHVNIDYDHLRQAISRVGVGLCSTLVSLQVLSWIFKYWESLTSLLSFP